MGGYARYVWPCFGFAGIVLALEPVGGAPFAAGRTREGRRAALAMAASEAR